MPARATRPRERPTRGCGYARARACVRACVRVCVCESERQGLAWASRGAVCLLAVCTRRFVWCCACVAAGMTVTVVSPWWFRI